MKKIFFSALFLLFITGSAQYYQVEYTFKRLQAPESEMTRLENKKLNRMAMSYVNDMLAYYALHRYILKFTEQESYYYVDAMEMPDDVSNPSMYKISLQGPIRAGNFYQNARTKEIRNSRETAGTLYLITGNMDAYDWKITGETKKINNYHCIKAILKCEGCKNPVEVWFTPEIPVPFGPAGYGGLPGLILEIKQFLNVLTLKKIKKLKNKPRIPVPGKGIKITEDEYRQLIMQRRMEAIRRKKASSGG